MGRSVSLRQRLSFEPGQTETLDYTFEDAGELLAGCHEPGHYDGGMVATIPALERREAAGTQSSATTSL